MLNYLQDEMDKEKQEAEMKRQRKLEKERAKTRLMSQTEMN